MNNTKLSEEQNFHNRKKAMVAERSRSIATTYSVKTSKHSAWLEKPKENAGQTG